MKKLLIFVLAIMPFALSYSQVAPPPTTRAHYVCEGIGFRVNSNSLKKRVDIELHSYYISWAQPTIGQLAYHYEGVFNFKPGVPQQVLFDSVELFFSSVEYAYFECIDDYKGDIIIIDCFEEKDEYIIPRNDGSYIHIKKTVEDIGWCLGTMMFEISHIGGE